MNFITRPPNRDRINWVLIGIGVYIIVTSFFDTDLLMSQLFDVLAGLSLIFSGASHLLPKAMIPAAVILRIIALVLICGAIVAFVYVVR